MPSLDMFTHADERGQSYAAGETIFSAGEPAGPMYVVLEGEVEIRIGNHSVETVGPTGFFGELSLIGRPTRMATVVARTAAKLEAIDQKRFTFLVQQHPTFALEVMKTLADRLVRMNELLLRG